MAANILLLLALTLFSYGLFARKIDQADITAPIVFTLAGILCGPFGLAWINTSIDDQAIMMIAELTLVIVLFTDASQIRWEQLTQFERYPIRLLGVGLPLTIACGTLLAVWLFEFSWPLAAVLAIILTPTDAALAQSVMDKKDIDIDLRQSINVESGLNDGIALPVLLMVLAVLMLDTSTQLDGVYWFEYISMQLVFGALSGVFIGRLGGYLINQAHINRWISPMYQRLSSISLAVIAFSAAELIQGNGFIAVFLAGLFMQTKHQIVLARIKEFGEAEGELLTLAVFFIFGAVFLPAAWPFIKPIHLIYALLSLTIVRMLPVWLSLSGTGLPVKSKAFLAWFGPRGIASILYLLLLIEQTGFDVSNHTSIQPIFATAVLTIMLSIFLHGASTSLWDHLFRIKAD